VGGRSLGRRWSIDPRLPTLSLTDRNYASVGRFVESGFLPTPPRKSWNLLGNDAKLTLIAKSNAMRCAAKENSDELTVVTQQLDSKLLQLKNFFLQ